MGVFILLAARAWSPAGLQLTIVLTVSDYADQPNHFLNISQEFDSE